MALSMFTQLTIKVRFSVLRAAGPVRTANAKVVEGFYITVAPSLSLRSLLCVDLLSSCDFIAAYHPRAFAQLPLYSCLGFFIAVAHSLSSLCMFLYARIRSCDDIQLRPPFSWCLLRLHLTPPGCWVCFDVFFDVEGLVCNVHDSIPGIRSSRV